MAILGEFVYSAMGEDSLTSAGRSPTRSHRTSLSRATSSSCRGSQGVLTDQHLQERDRIGRTVTLLARLLHDGWIEHAARDRRRPRDRRCTSIRRPAASKCSPRRTIRRRTCTS